MNRNFWKGKKVLITGHTGFKGSWLSMLLIELGAKVSGLSNKNENDKLFKLLKIEKKLKSYCGDINNSKLIKRIIKEQKPEFIFHLAAQSIVSLSYKLPYETFITNSLGTLNVIENSISMRAVKTIIVVTSDKCYKDTNKKSGYNENDMLGGTDIYSSSKAAAELIVSSYQKMHIHNSKNPKIGIASVRAGNVIGGGDWAANRLIPDVIRSYKSKKKLKIRNPQYVRPWQYVLDPLNGYLILAEKLNKNPKKYSSAWNFGPSMVNAKTVSWVLNRLISLLNINIKVFDEIEKNKFLETRFLKLSSKKSIQKLKWKPIFNINQTLIEVSNWYKADIMKEDVKKITINQVKNFIDRF